MQDKAEADAAGQAEREREVAGQPQFPSSTPDFVDNLEETAELLPVSHLEPLLEELRGCMSRLKSQQDWHSCEETSRAIGGLYIAIGQLEQLAAREEKELQELPAQSTYEATSSISKEEVLERLDNLTTDFAMKSAKIKVQGGVETLRFFADDFEKFVSNLDFLLDDIKRGVR